MMRKILLIALLVMSVAACSSKKKEEEGTKAVQESSPPAEEKSAVPVMSAKLKEDAPTADEPASTRDATPTGRLEDEKVLVPMGVVDQESTQGKGLALPAPAAPAPLSPPPSAPHHAKKRAVGFHQMDEEEPTQE